MQTIEVAKQSGIWVGLCGEMSSDVVSAFLLMGMGIDELSASPYVVPEIKEMVRTSYFSEAKEIAEKALTVFDPVEVRRLVLDCIGKEFPDMLL
jgi:phosphoenolpyruvate-protein kinase (PTS system EI component)